MAAFICFLVVLAACAGGLPVQNTTESTITSVTQRIYNDTCSVPPRNVSRTGLQQRSAGPFQLVVTVRYYNGEERNITISSDDTTTDVDNRQCHLEFNITTTADSNGLPGLEKIQNKINSCVIKFPGVEEAQYAPNNFFSLNQVGGSSTFNLQFSGNYKGPHKRNTWDCLVSASGDVNDFRPQRMFFQVDYKGCPVGFYGGNCTRNCACQNGAMCHSFNGACQCAIGWTGPACDIEDRRVTVRIEPDPVYLTEDAMVICDVVNLGKRTVTWRFGTEALKNYSVVQHSTYIESRIFIDYLTDSDNGEYTCQALSSNGSVVSATVKLNVTECNPDWWGVSCRQRCNCSFLGTTECHRYHGCICRAQWTGHTCDTQLRPAVTTMATSALSVAMTPSIDQPDTWIVPVIVAVLLLVLVGAAVALIYWFRQRAPPDDSVGISEELLSRLHDSQWMKDPGDLTFLGQIGQGEFGHVVRAQLSEGGNSRILAAKGLRTDNVRSTGKYSLERELKVLLDVTEDGGHPNVIQLYGVILSKGLIYILLEYIGKRDLQGLLQAVNMKAAIPSSFGRECLSYARDTVAGLAYLDRCKVVHRDLAARNILITNNNVAKLSDFGLSCGIYQELSETKAENPLPWRWMAPECLRYDDEFSSKSDIWSFGVVLWEMSTLGATPYPYITSQQKLLRYLIRNKERMGQPSRCSDAVFQVMLSCWQESPNYRPSAVSLEGIFSSMLALNKELFKPSVYSEDAM